MLPSKVPSDLDLQVRLLNRIAEYKHVPIQISDLLPPIINDILASAEPESEHSLFSAALGREDEYRVWEGRIIDTLSEMYKNEGWIEFKCLDNQALFDVFDIAPEYLLKDKHSI